MELSCKLIETFAENVANILLTEFKVEKLKLSIQKPGAVSGTSSVGVIIERGNGHYS